MDKFIKNKKIIIFLLCISLVGVIFIYNFFINDKQVNNINSSSEQKKDNSLNKEDKGNQKDKKEDVKGNSKFSNQNEKKETSKEENRSTSNEKTIEDKNNENSQKNITKYSDGNSDNNKNLINKEAAYTSKKTDKNHSSDRLDLNKKVDITGKQDENKEYLDKKTQKFQVVKLLNQNNGNYSIEINKINNKYINIIVNSKVVNDSNHGTIIIYNNRNSLAYIDQGKLEKGQLKFNTQLEPGKYTGYYKVEGEKSPISFEIK